jgi:hypothetical protein
MEHRQLPTVTDARTRARTHTRLQSLSVCMCSRRRRRRCRRTTILRTRWTASHPTRSSGGRCGFTFAPPIHVEPHVAVSCQVFTRESIRNRPPPPEAAEEPPPRAPIDPGRMMHATHSAQRTANNAQQVTYTCHATMAEPPTAPSSWHLACLITSPAPALPPAGHCCSLVTLRHLCCVRPFRQHMTARFKPL